MSSKPVSSAENISENSVDHAVARANGDALAMGSVVNAHSVSVSVHWHWNGFDDCFDDARLRFGMPLSLLNIDGGNRASGSR